MKTIRIVKFLHLKKYSKKIFPIKKLSLALKEAQLIHQGKIKAISLDQFLKEL